MKIQVEDSKTGETLATGEASKDGKVKWEPGSDIEVVLDAIPATAPGKAGYLKALRQYISRSTTMRLSR